MFSLLKNSKFTSFILKVKAGQAIIVNVLIAIIGCTTSLPTAVSVLQTLINLFDFVWYIIGTVWFFQDDTCKEKWHSGYIVSLILVIFLFLTVIPFLGMCCVSLINAFRVIATTTSKND